MLLCVRTCVCACVHVECRLYIFNVCVCVCARALVELRVPTCGVCECVSRCVVVWRNGRHTHTHTQRLEISDGKPAHTLHICAFDKVVARVSIYECRTRPPAVTFKVHLCGVLCVCVCVCVCCVCECVCVSIYECRTRPPGVTFKVHLYGVCCVCVCVCVSILNAERACTLPADTSLTHHTHTRTQGSVSDWRDKDSVWRGGGCVCGLRGCHMSFGTAICSVGSGGATLLCAQLVVDPQAHRFCVWKSHLEPRRVLRKLQLTYSRTYSVIHTRTCTQLAHTHIHIQARTYTRTHTQHIPTHTPNTPRRQTCTH